MTKISQAWVYGIDGRGQIEGSSISIQACYVGCAGISRTQAGDVVYTYGGGTPQIGVSGSQMQFTGVVLSPEETRSLKVK